MSKRIFLDPGHGGRDPGAVSNGLNEKNVVLNLALRIGKLLQSMGADVRYSRTTDVYVSLSERARIANQWGADAFFSLHINASSTPSSNGFETFVHSSISGGRTAAIQNVVHRKIAQEFSSVGSRDRGQKKANFQVLRETKMPALLLEYGFITNTRENELLRNPLFIDRLARATAEGIGQALGLNPIPSSDPLPQIQRACNVKFNGRDIGQGFLINNTSYIPARLVSEALGATVGWDDVTKTVLINK